MTSADMPRIGVVVCECGQKIASKLDLPQLCQQTRTLPGVVFVEQEAYPCSKDGQIRINQAIREHNLDRLLVAGCSPRLVGEMFRSAVSNSELDPDFLKVVNIREGIIADRSGDSALVQRAAQQSIRMGVAHLRASVAGGSHNAGVQRSVLIIGEAASAAYMAKILAQREIQVIWLDSVSVESSNGGKSNKALPDKLIPPGAEIIEDSSIQRIEHGQIQRLQGRPGDYHVEIAHSAGNDEFNVGAIVIDIRNDDGDLPVDSTSWRPGAKTLHAYEFDLQNKHNEAVGWDYKNVVFLHHHSDGQSNSLTMLNDYTCLDQAIRTIEIDPDINVTVLYEDLHIGVKGGLGEARYHDARSLGVRFVPYTPENPPNIQDDLITIQDSQNGEMLQIPYDQLVLSVDSEPDRLSDSLARWLHIPQDDEGRLIEPRIRLRPGMHVHPGVFIVGDAHLPVDEHSEWLQAYMATSRVARYLDSEEITTQAPVVQIDPDRCTGCGQCLLSCSFHAIHLRERESSLSLAEVDPFRCTGCGNCVVECPVKAISMPIWNDQSIIAQIDAAVDSPGQESQHPQESPSTNVLAFLCEWSGLAAAEVAGARGLSYPNRIRNIPLLCSARIDPDHILYALLRGVDGVFIGACSPGECHHGCGNRFTAERTEKIKAWLQDNGISPSRLRYATFDPDEGQRLADALTAFESDMRQFA